MNDLVAVEYTLNPAEDSWDAVGRGSVATPNAVGGVFTFDDPGSVFDGTKVFG